MILGISAKVLFKFPGKTAMLRIAHLKSDLGNTFFTGLQQSYGLLKPADAQIVKHTGAVSLSKASVKFVFVNADLAAKV